MNFPKVTRDLILFVAGLAGVVYETVVVKIDRPTLLIVFSGMMGLPVFLRRDEKDPPNDPPQQPPSSTPDSSSSSGATSGAEGG
jgi:hypothetical protein